MKALSIRQPWASLIVMGLKDVENRTWVSRYRGPLLIHVAQGYDRDGAMFLHSRPEFREDTLALIKRGYLLPSGFPRGAIIGRVEMVDCVTESTSKWFFGPHGFVIERAVEFEFPISLPGSQRFFEVPHFMLTGAGLR